MASAPIRIENIADYVQSIDDGTLVLRQRKQYTTDLDTASLIGSQIQECVVMNGDTIITQKTKYLKIYIDLMVSLPAKKRFENTTFKFKDTDEKGLNGFVWIDKLNRSMQRKNAPGTMKEIINKIKANKYSLDMSIKLESGQLIYFKID